MYVNTRSNSTRKQCVPAHCEPEAWLTVLDAHRIADGINEDILIVADSVPHGESEETFLVDEGALVSCRRISDTLLLKSDEINGPKLVASS